MIDHSDLLALSGIVDLYGDAFGRAVTPCSGVAFPYETAPADADSQLLACGITTESYGVTHSWEGGLRGRAYAVHMLGTLDAMHPHLGAQYLMRLHFELHHADGAADVLVWMDTGHVHFLSFNDHLPMMRGKLGDTRELAQYADRAEYDTDTFLVRPNAATANATRPNEVTGTLARVVQ